VLNRDAAGNRAGERGIIHCRAFVDSVELPPRILILGAGPDAARWSVWRRARLAVTVFDHRPAYAVATHFPQAQRVATAPADELTAVIDLGEFDAAVVMSHHLKSDLAYLQQLAVTPLSYIGLLGPEPRRQRLLADVGAHRSALSGRLFGPVGLDIGARTPEAIALAILQESRCWPGAAAGSSRDPNETGRGSRSPIRFEAPI
jgi:xanthine/CO dehydrogenase XdhC/CoxF family maturation factor